jgi:type IV pilus assembly protein PilX
MKTLQRPPSRERGVVLIFTLIILLILTIGGAALVRSMQSSLFSAGNLAFRRDLMNQGEQAVSTVLTQFKAGGALVSATDADLAAANYKSSILPANAQGVPLALLDSDAAFSLVGSAPDLIGATSDVRIRYVIDRLCSVTGPASSTLCVQSSANASGGSSFSSYGGSVPPPTATVYRLSVRVSGARSTQVFLQTTFTKPD